MGFDFFGFYVCGLGELFVGVIFEGGVVDGGFVVFV